VALGLPEGLTQSAPATQGVLWPGEERLVAMRLAGDVSGEVVLTGRLGEESFERRYRIDLEPKTVAGNAFLPRLWAERRIADLEAEDATAHRKKIVELSKRHHVVSRHTSLLVLESPAMARAFKVEDTRPPTDWTGDEQAEAKIADYDAQDDAASGPGSVLKDLMVSKAPSVQQDGYKGIGAGAGGGSTKIRVKKKTVAKSSGAGQTTILRTLRPRIRGRGMLMKRVWYREATIRAHREPGKAEQRELTRREERLAEQPESRDRTRELCQWYLRMGMVGKAEALAQRWLEKDRMDAGALIVLADVAALRGDAARSEALLASAVEVDHTLVAAQDRMVGLYLAAGEPQLACAHRLAAALQSPESIDHLVAAARCDSDAERHFAWLQGAKRRKADKALAKAPKGPRTSDKITIEASWETEADLDIVVLDPRGRRTSWQGGAKRVAATQARGLTSETLAMSADALGRYKVFIVHAAATKGGGERAAPVTGKATIRSYGGVKRTVPFTTDGRSANLASLRVVSKSRMEEVTGGEVNPPPPPPPGVVIRGRVRGGHASRSGGRGQIDKRDVSRVLRRRAGAVRKCYEKALRRNPNLSGKLTVKFQIGTNARITRIKIMKNRTGDAGIANCVKAKMRSWKFKAPTGGAVTFSTSWTLH
jgi:hypothetical protein